MGAELLPGSAFAWERAVAEAMDTSDTASPAIQTIRGTKIVVPPPSFLPFLIYEYGLGELTPYVPNLYDLIAEGIDWQRLRGTPAAMTLALGWLGYNAAIEEESTRRRFWNLFQLHLGRVRDEDADLAGIEGVARLSVPKRSVFWRGFHGFDIRPLTFSESHYSEAHYGEYSGRRLREGGPLWSFGREYQFDLTPSDADLKAIGVFVDAVDQSVEVFEFGSYWFEAPLAALEEDPPSADALGWGDFSWDSTEASWTSGVQQARSEAMASGLLGRVAWFAFFDAGGAAIGYRRARAVRVVEPALSGVYSVNGATYRPKATADTLVYAECLTGFGEGAGAAAATVGLVFDAVPVDPDRPGQMWLAPDQISGGTDVACLSPVSIVFGETIRERFKMLLRF